MSPSRFLCTALATLLALVQSVDAQPHFDFFHPVTPPRAVQITAHRGMHVVAPENTAAAFQACADDFIEWCEADVRLTADNVHVILHDATVDRTLDATGKVSEMTLAQCRDLRIGTREAPRFADLRMLTLVELLQAAKGRVNIDLDCKDVNVPMLVREITQAGMEKQVVCYGNADFAREVRDAGGGRIAATTKFRPASMQFDDFVRDVAPAAIEIDADVVTPEWCRRFHDAGIQVQVKVLGEWDRPEVWMRVLACKPDRLQTDDPAGLRRVQLQDVLKRSPTRIAFHRGASRYAPENTLPSITEAVRLGADLIELDLRTGADGTVFLMHDGSLARTCGLMVRAADVTRDQLASVSAGTWFSARFRDASVPTLEDALHALQEAWIYADAKAIEPDALIGALKRAGMMERHVVYGSAEYARSLRAIDPSIRTLIPLGRAEDLEGALAQRPYAVDASWEIVTADLVAQCHAAGVLVFSDAMGENETVQSYLNAMKSGIDVIQTDHPLRVWRAMELSHQP